MKFRDKVSSAYRGSSGRTSADLVGDTDLRTLIFLKRGTPTGIEFLNIFFIHCIIYFNLCDSVVVKTYDSAYWMNGQLGD